MSHAAPNILECDLLHMCKDSIECKSKSGRYCPSRLMCDLNCFLQRLYEFVRVPINPPLCQYLILLELLHFAGLVGVRLS